MAKQKRPTGKQDEPPWPTLEEQLAAAKVIPGSALEKLIKDNQDATLLDASEHPDDIWKFPLWLRVWWRRKHPELKYKSHLVFYPPLLRRLRQWMLINQGLNADLISMEPPAPSK